jgi:hypothetical protein
MATPAEGQPLRCADCNRPLKRTPLNLATGMGRCCVMKRPEGDPARELLLAHDRAEGLLGLRITSSRPLTVHALWRVLGEWLEQLPDEGTEPATGLQRMAAARWGAALQLAQVHGIEAQLHAMRASHHLRQSGF